MITRRYSARSGTSMAAAIRMLAIAVPLNAATLLTIVAVPTVAGFAGWLIAAPKDSMLQRARQPPPPC